MEGKYGSIKTRIRKSKPTRWLCISTAASQTSKARPSEVFLGCGAKVTDCSNILCSFYRAKYQRRAVVWKWHIAPSVEKSVALQQHFRQWYLSNLLVGACSWENVLFALRCRDHGVHPFQETGPPDIWDCISVSRNALEIKQFIAWHGIIQMKILLQEFLFSHKEGKEDKTTPTGSESTVSQYDVNTAPRGHRDNFTSSI